MNAGDDAYSGGPIWSRCRVVGNQRVACQTYCLRFEEPTLASRIAPGQFVMVRIAHCLDPLLGRPFALYDTHLGVDRRPWGIDIVYQVAGKLTTRLSRLDVGDEIEVWGPLGNGFALRPVDNLVLVAGGIGMTPFPAVVRAALGERGYGGQFPLRSSRSVVFFYGVRTADYLVDLDDFRSLGVPVHIATEDGSLGVAGFVTRPLRDYLESLPPESSHVLTCGPEIMMEAVSAACAEHGVSCEVSLETPMACGIGACFTCVAKIRLPDGGGAWDYQRTCVDGPVYDSRRVVW